MPSAGEQHALHEFTLLTFGDRGQVNPIYPSKAKLQRIDLFGELWHRIPRFECSKQIVEGFLTKKGVLNPKIMFFGKVVSIKVHQRSTCCICQPFYTLMQFNAASGIFQSDHIQIFDPHTSNYIVLIFIRHCIKVIMKCFSVSVFFAIGLHNPLRLTSPGVLPRLQLGSLLWSYLPFLAVTQAVAVLWGLLVTRSLPVMVTALVLKPQQQQTMSRD